VEVIPLKRLLAPILLAAISAGVAASVAVVALSGGSSPAKRTTYSSPVMLKSNSGARREAAQTTLSATEIYKRDASGVVTIKAVTSEGEDTGTGIVLNEQGLIVTNDHVVQGATSISVSQGSSSTTTHAGALVGEEANDDLALIKVDPTGLGLKPLHLVNSSSVQVGDSVYAIGNPYGLNETLTRGIVSALGREISAPDGAKITGVLQTDAALNPGNSGGPLLNEQGEVIGVNSQIASDAARTEGSQPGSTGVGFAIASNTVAEAIHKIQAGQGVASASTQQQSQSQSQGGTEGQQSPYGSRSPYEAQSPYGQSTPGVEGSEGVEGESTEGGGEVVSPEREVESSEPEGDVVIVP
jgi:putative serine protease PepD